MPHCTVADGAARASETDSRTFGFLSGRFVGASSRWSTIEKEAFAIVESTRRLEYLLLRPAGFRLYTDHRNLVYIFNPYATDGAMARYRADKLQRWALSLMSFKYVIEHVPGEEDVWGDLLSRLGAGQALEAHNEAVRVARLAVVQRVSPLEEPEFVWPSESEIHASQEAARASGQIMTGTYSLGADVAAFVNGCLHCMTTASGRFPHPFGETLVATKPNKLLRFDYHTMVEGEGGLKYVLVLKDGMSGYVELVACWQETTDIPYRALIDWFKRLGVVHQWASDQGAHFRNQIIEQLQRALGAHHHFVTAYTPWANGTVEVVNCEVLKAMKALLSEHSILHPREPVDTPVEWVTLELQAHLEEVRVALDGIHAEMVEASEKHRRAARERHSRRKGVKLQEFSEADFILAATVTGRSGNKLALLWRGPKRIAKALNDFTFKMADIIPPFDVSVRHASRQQLYREAARGHAEELQE
ncbi:unnamed protein product [Phytophthora fragariaefolia]|uniref:Unnamed protein product n=1 Tax=Phytophthora fragariaefolia TaxID=1490495 RepID=A0A9W6XQK6_9STRA|nr:unnamed protein product [Phytophthora fragariaefolia]